MSSNQIEVLLDRYLKGETTTEESALVARWLEENSNPDNAWQVMDQSAKDQWLLGVFREINATIHAGNAKVVQLAPRKPLLWQNIASIAAVLLICFTMYVIWQPLQTRLYPAQLATLQVPANQKKQVTLADGSQIWVNAGSQLQYPQTFNGKTREVYLSGEAYFDIAHDAAKPFIIHTGTLITTVMGTAFNIKEDKTKQTVEVTVTRGKVSVANGTQLLGVLTPDEQLSFNTAKNKAVKGNVNAQQVIVWQQSELHFEDISFADAVSKLQKQFNVRISFSNDKLKNCRFTGTALKGEQLDHILQVICAFNNATYQTQPDASIVIDGPGCN